MKLRFDKINYFDIGMAYISMVVFYMLCFLVFDLETVKLYFLGFYNLIINWAYYTGLGTTVFEISNYFKKTKFHANAKNQELFFYSILIYLYTLLTVLFFDLGITYLSTGSSELFWKSIYLRTISSSLISVIYIIRNYKQVIQENAELNVSLKADLQKESEKATRAQLNMLKIQLDPHFMFNSLNALVGLIDENPKKAEHFTLELSRVYKYIVANIDADFISLKEGIDFICNYCRLIEIRYPQQFKIQIAEDLVKSSEESILPLSLQLLVENAIKHNQHSTESPLMIHIMREDNYICVSNTLHPYPENEQQNFVDSTGIGMKNLYERYKLLTDRIPVVLKTKSEYIVKVPII